MRWGQSFVVLSSPLAGTCLPNIHDLDDGWPHSCGEWGMGEKVDLYG